MKTVILLAFFIMVAAAFFIGFEVGKTSNAVPTEHARALVYDHGQGRHAQSVSSELYSSEATEPGDWSPPPMMTVVKWNALELCQAGVQGRSDALPPTRISSAQ
jgi:hypothetical protein